MIYITSKQMAQVDNTAIKKYGISVFQLMELAGRNLARFVSSLIPVKTIVLVGKGNNGGDGLVAAKYLAIQGKQVEIVLAQPALNTVAKKQLAILKKMKIPIVKEINAGKGDIIIDALLGYNIKGKPKATYAKLIKKANLLKKKGVLIVALDVPSGMHPDTGKKFSPCIDPDHILTLALPKIGLSKTKNVVLANIGIPKQVYEDLGIRIRDYFSHDDLVHI